MKDDLPESQLRLGHPEESDSGAEWKLDTHLSSCCIKLAKSVYLLSPVESTGGNDNYGAAEKQRFSGEKKSFEPLFLTFFLHLKTKTKKRALVPSVETLNSVFAIMFFSFSEFVH